MLRCYYRDTKIKASKFRKQGYIPAIIYGPKMVEPVMIYADERLLVDLLYEKTMGESVVLNVEGDVYEAKIQAINLNENSGRLEHMDFMQCDIK